MATHSNPVAPLGSQGLQVARLGFGCMSLSSNLVGGEPVDAEQAAGVLKRAHELGVRLFNTSDLYGPFTNEELLGKALGPVKDEAGIVFATKWGALPQPGKGIVNDCSSANCRKSCEGALKRLGVQSVDLFTYRGPPGADSNFEEAMQELKALVSEGKVKYVGLSEVPAHLIRKAHSITPISAVEIEWSLFSRDVERDIVPTCRELGIGIMAYSPLGRGMLTGAIRSLDQLHDKDFRKLAAPRFAHLDKNLELVDRVAALAAKKGCTPGQLALAWVLARGPDVFPIPGTKRVSYLEENMGALGVELSAEEAAELEAAVPEERVVGDRYANMHHATYHGAQEQHH